MPPRRGPKRKKSIVDKDDKDLVKEKRYFKNPKLISDHLHCSICQEVFEDPLRLHCGHSFCTKCIDIWFKTKNTCPVDRVAIKRNMCHKDFLTANIIGDLEVACPWRPFGCNQLDKYYLINFHKENCEYNINKMDPVIQEKLLLDYKESSFDSPNLADSKKVKSTSSFSSINSNINSTSSNNSETKMSALDWLMSQNQSDDEDAKLDANDSMSHIPEEVEIPPLSMRLYLSANERERDVLKEIFKK